MTLSEFVLTTASSVVATLIAQNFLPSLAKWWRLERSGTPSGASIAFLRFERQRLVGMIQELQRMGSEREALVSLLRHIALSIFMVIAFGYSIYLVPPSSGISIRTLLVPLAVGSTALICTISLMAGISIYARREASVAKWQHRIKEIDALITAATETGNRD